MSADCFTLEDYIKKKNIDGSLSLMNLRKKERNIDENELNASLDEIARKNASKRGLKCGISKFDRFNDDSGNQSDDEDLDEISSGSNYRESYDKINSDMEMMDISEQNNIQAENSSIRFAKEIQNMEHPECCRIKKHFTTVESAMGIKMKSQQWRVENPSSDKVLNGRVQKNYKKNSTNGPKAGIFIEKGNFTYKFNDDPSNDSEDNAESIVGIVRNRPVTKIIRVGNNNGGSNSNNYNNNNRNFNNNFRNRQNGNGSSPVNINMNWNGFFKGMTECMKTAAPATQPLERKVNDASSSNQDIQVKIAATELLDFLIAKRDKSNHKVSFSEQPKMADPVNEYIVSATAGNGIDMDVTPSVTNLPMNLRFA
ncbi:unnamed protein product [Chironomus riparius]|uniref:Uncharacterized protein n=1 Tax=Chironomus riparius TaxID=315576 RepID=A0A9N9RNJ8_9DIPT|nr:unnamed protein product [Chironomus riparius]